MRTLIAGLCLLPLLLAPAADAQQGGTQDEMRDANRAAAVLLTERLKRDRPAGYVCLRRITRRDLLVVRGTYDHVEWVLRDIGVPYAETEPALLERTSLAGVQAVLVNCPGRVGPRAIRRLRDFVRDGGLLFTTDWSVAYLIEPGFPGTLCYTRKPTRDDVVSIRILRPEHLFLKDVLTGSDRHLWWLESQSYPFRVLSRNVEVMIDSPEMARKYGAAPIAATFRYGRGRVVHIVSHFYLQRSELRTRRDLEPAPVFAGDLGFGAGSPAVKRLKKEKLDAVESGKLRSAYSAQQFLANILIETCRVPRVEPPRTDPVPPYHSSGIERTCRATVLRDAPDGKAVKALPAGLRLSVLESRRDWLKVSTPAGETGWVAANAVTD